MVDNTKKYRQIIVLALASAAFAAYLIPFNSGPPSGTQAQQSSYETLDDGSDDTASPTEGSSSPTESAADALPTDVASCLGSGACQLVTRDIYQRVFLPIIPEYILQLRPELCLDVKINDVADEIMGIPGASLIHVYDLPNFQAVSFRGYPGPELLNDERFVDYNATSPDVNAEIDRSSGHSAQILDSDNDTEILESSQVLPSGLERTIEGMAFINNTLIDSRSNLLRSNITSTNITSTNASSLTPTAAGCEMQRVIPISTDSNMSASDVNVDIAVLDTGVSLTHPDLNVYRDVTFVNGTTTGNDDLGHGSHVAGIAAAKDNDIGIVGIAPGARIWAIKVCDSSGECKITNQIKGVEYAIKHANEIDVLNISIENPNSPALNSIIDAAVRAGITVVVSAGNYGKDASATTPANSPSVITVSAIADSDGVCGAAGPDLSMEGDNTTMTDDTFAYFSNFGPAVKMSAPGVNVLSTYTGSGYAVDSGTSMAAPYVSGAAALYKAQHPYATPSEVMAAILGAGSLPDTPCDGAAHGYFTGDLDNLPEPLLYGSPEAASTITPVTSRPSG